MEGARLQIVVGQRAMIEVFMARLWASWARFSMQRGWNAPDIEVTAHLFQKKVFIAIFSCDILGQNLEMTSPGFSAVVRFSGFEFDLSSRELRKGQTCGRTRPWSSSSTVSIRRSIGFGSRCAIHRRTAIHRDCRVRDLAFPLTPSHNQRASVASLRPRCAITEEW